MNAEELLRAGDLAGCLDKLQDQVRSDPSDAKLRVFLFQLLAVLGQWERARTQLEVAGDLDASTLAMVNAYRETLASEPFRHEVFSGARTPLVFGDPEEWIALLVESLRVAAGGKADEADELRNRGFEGAEATSGSIVLAKGDDESDPIPFEWIADSDPRLGPLLEAIIDGKYYWVPISRIQKMVFETPNDLRDMVWTPVFFTWANGGESAGFVPTRYIGTELSDNAAAKLARTTDWSEAGTGIGQRMLATDAGEYPILEIRQITLNCAEPEQPTETDEA